MKRTLTRIAMSLLATLMAAVSLVSANVVTAAPAAAHGDACSEVPDKGPFFNFHDACHNHDNCYFHKPHGNNSAGRKQCDEEFLKDMRNYCGRVYNKWYEKPSKQICKGIAWSYYVGVRNYGSKYFYQAGPGTYPAAPTNVRAHRYSTSAGEITWNRATDPDGIVVRYEIHRDGRWISSRDALSIYQQLPRGTYQYKIVAVDNHGKKSQPTYVKLTL